MLWDVTYYREYGNSYAGHDRTIQLEADTISRARSEALVLIGRAATIVRIDQARPEVPVTDPARRKVQGT